jgi:hypothetical protein
VVAARHVAVVDAVSGVGLEASNVGFRGQPVAKYLSLAEYEVTQIYPG